MPTYFARATGSINGAIWATTPTGTAQTFFPFASGDVLVANSFNVTINVNTDLGNGTITTDNRDGATSGGVFGLSTGVTLTANVVAGSTNQCINVGSGTIVGSVTGGTGTSGGGAVNINTAGATCNVIGNVTGGTGSNAYGANVGSNGGTISITGNVTGGSGSPGCWAQSGAGNYVVTGSVTGSPTSTQAGMSLNNTATGSATVVGTATGGAGGSVGVAVTSGAASASVTRAKGGPLAGSAAGVSNGTGGSTVTVDEIEYGDLGASPCSGAVRFADKSSNVAVLYRAGLAKATLADVSSLLPAASNVRSGVSYASGTRTGTMAVPPAASVANGVAVGSTTGTALLNPADFWNYATSAATTSGSMGERLANAATVASTGQQLANALTP